MWWQKYPHTLNWTTKKKIRKIYYYIFLKNVPLSPSKDVYRYALVYYITVDILIYLSSASNSTNIPQFWESNPFSKQAIWQTLQDHKDSKCRVCDEDIKKYKRFSNEMYDVRHISSFGTRIQPISLSTPESILPPNTFNHIAQTIQFFGSYNFIIIIISMMLCLVDDGGDVSLRKHSFIGFMMFVSCVIFKKVSY